MRYAIAAIIMLAAGTGACLTAHASGKASQYDADHANVVTVTFTYGTQPTAFLDCVKRNGNVTKGPSFSVASGATAEGKIGDNDICAESLYSLAQ
jgi:hypothetical protein